MESFLNERKQKVNLSTIGISDDNLKNYFNDNQVNNILSVDLNKINNVIGCDEVDDDDNVSGTKYSNNNNLNSSQSKRINSFLFDRTQFIIKLLRICREKLSASNDEILAKGLEWLSKEIQDSILFKTDKQSIQKLDQLKKKNKELHTIFSWLEEYSTINNNQGEGFTIKPIKSNFEIDDLVINSFADGNINTYPLQLENNYINFSEEHIKTIEEPTFDIFKLESEVGQDNILSTVSCFIFTTMGFYAIIKYDKFECFIQEIAKGYTRDNRYHTDLHAADVLQTCSIFLKFGGITDKLKLSESDVCALLISTIIHDYKHPGRTNLFLINTGHPIAIKYNDVSVLENYHVAEAFALIKSKEQFNIFSELSKDDYKTMRKRIIECVLATDMTFHAKQFTYLKLKIESLGIINGENVDKLLEGLDKMGVYSTQQEFMNITIHASDISNPTKPFTTYKKWADRVMDEFWMQGDQEKQLHLPVSFLCDRSTVTIPGAQIGFISGIVFPFMQALREIFPGLNFLIENLNENTATFTKLKEEEDAIKKNININGI